MLIVKTCSIGRSCIIRTVFIGFCPCRSSVGRYPVFVDTDTCNHGTVTVLFTGLPCTVRSCSICDIKNDDRRLILEDLKLLGLSDIHKEVMVNVYIYYLINKVAFGKIERSCIVVIFIVYGVSVGYLTVDNI